MTTKHIVDGLMQTTKASSHNHRTELLDLPQGLLCRMFSGNRKNLAVSTLAHIHEMSGVPLNDLFHWFSMPDGSILPRMKISHIKVNNKPSMVISYEGVYK